MMVGGRKMSGDSLHDAMILLKVVLSKAGYLGGILDCGK